jgi:hypothetical protein
MAHECPNCGMICHCGGDIDDICFSGTSEEFGCTHCDGDDTEEEYWCSTCGYIDHPEDHESHCPHFREEL